MHPVNRLEFANLKSYVAVAALARRDIAASVAELSVIGGAEITSIVFDCIVRNADRARSLRRWTRALRTAGFEQNQGN